MKNTHGFFHVGILIVDAIILIIATIANPSRCARDRRPESLQCADPFRQSPKWTVFVLERGNYGRSAVILQHGC
jgi:hypothetical protein